MSDFCRCWEDVAEAIKRFAVILSGYRSELYDELFPDWPRLDRPSFADGARPRVESIWLSPAASAGAGAPRKEAA